MTPPTSSCMSRGFISPVSPRRGCRANAAPCLVLDCDEDDVSAYRRVARLDRKWGRDRRADWAEAEADAFKALAAQWLPRFDLLLAACGGRSASCSARTPTVSRCLRRSECRPHGTRRSVPRCGRRRTPRHRLHREHELPTRISTRRCGLPCESGRGSVALCLSNPVRHSRIWSAARSDGPRQAARHRTSPAASTMCAALPARCACRGADQGRWRHAHQVARKRQAWRSRRGDAVWCGGHRLAVGP